MCGQPMNRLHVNGLPADITEAALRDLFEQVGTVESVKIYRRSDGQCIGFGIVKMQCAEDIEEILESQDRLAIGGIRPYIWQVQYSTVSSLIRTESNGIHIGRCKDRWYVFKLNYGHLE